MKNKVIYEQKDVVFNEVTGKLAVGNLEIELNYLFAVNAVEVEKEIFDIILRYKNSQYDMVRVNKNAYDLLKFNINHFEISKTIKEQEKEEKQIKRSKSKSFLGINYNFWVLYIILIFGFMSARSEELNETFDYKYVYDVNLDKCDNIENYRNKFTYQELSDPKFVGEFPKRPGELVFVSLSDEMYVFTDTELRCVEYQKYFIEEMIKQIKDAENQLDSFNFEE